MQKHTFTKLLVALSTIFSTFLFARSASADTIDLMWDPNPEPQVIGYEVHVGTQSGTYTQHIDVGPTTAWSFTSAACRPDVLLRRDGVRRQVRSKAPRSNEACG